MKGDKSQESPHATLIPEMELKQCWDFNKGGYVPEAKQELLVEISNQRQ